MQPSFLAELKAKRGGENTGGFRNLGSAAASSTSRVVSAKMAAPSAPASPSSGGNFSNVDFCKLFAGSFAVQASFAWNLCSGSLPNKLRKITAANSNAKNRYLRSFPQTT